MSCSSPCVAPEGRRRCLRVLGATGLGLVLTGGPAALRAQAGPQRPPELQGSALAEARLQGQAPLRWFGLLIYEARLWSLERIEAARHAEQVFALELIYARRLQGRAIAERSIDEMRALAPLDAARAAAWQAELAAAFPDVQPGERLLGLHRPDQGLDFFHQGRPTRRIADAALARRFFAIWLAPEGREPALRRALLGEAG